MAATITASHKAGLAPSSPTFVHRFLVTFAAADYAAGGYLLGLAARIGTGKTVINVECRGFTTANGNPATQFFEYNTVSDKLMALAAGTRAEVANATDLSALTCEVTVTSV